MLRGRTSSTLCAAYTDKEDHATHTSMSNLHHAIKYLGKLGPAWSSAGALPSLRCLEEEAYISLCTDSALSKGDFHLQDNVFMGTCGTGRCDAPGDQTTPHKPCTLCKQDKIMQFQRLMGSELLCWLNKLIYIICIRTTMDAKTSVLSVDQLCIFSWNSLEGIHTLCTVQKRGEKALPLNHNLFCTW